MTTKLPDTARMEKPRSSNDLLNVTYSAEEARKLKKMLAYITLITDSALPHLLIKAVEEC